MPRLNNGSEGDSQAGSSQTSSGRTKPRRDGNAAHNVPTGAGNVEVQSDMGDFVKATRSAHQVLKSVGEFYHVHETAIQEATKNQQRVVELEAFCKKQEDEIERCNTALDVMWKRSKIEEVALNDHKARFEEEKQDFEQMKDEFLRSKQKDESKARDLEDRLKRQAEAKLKKETADMEKCFREDRDKLERALKQREEGKKKMMTDLETKNKQLSSKVNDLESQVNSYGEILAREREKLDDMEQLKRLSKEEATKYLSEFQKLKAEFGLASNSPEFFQKRFCELAEKIHNLSTKFCQDLNPKDWSPNHEKLKNLDHARFASVPISNSENSKLLRAAHTERILSHNLSTLVFTPFSTDRTFQAERRTAICLLEEAALGLMNAGGNRRAAAVFQSLALRGFRLPNQLQAVSPASLTRTDVFIQAVNPVLSLLIPEAQHKNLHGALRSLAQSAISIWESAQIDEVLDIKASLDLDSSLHMHWRSPMFDTDCDPTDRPIASSTPSRIFTLFPRFTAKAFTAAPGPAVKVPGSFEHSKPEIHLQELCIHPGIGMRESSALVWKGRVEQEEVEEELKDEMLRKELEATTRALSERNKMKSQRHGSITSLPFPSAEGSMSGRSKKVPDE